MKSFRLRQSYHVLIFVLISIFLASLNAFAAVPTTQTAGGMEKLQSDIDKSKELQKRLKEDAKKVKAQEGEVVVEAPEGEKVLITKINVEGALLLSDIEIAKITSEYENKSISFAGMQKVADLITDAYRVKGYVTTRAFIPPQTIKQDGVLLIRVVEGTVGDISISGNKYFKTSIYKKKLQLKKGDSFNYSSLQKSLALINERPDRFAKVVLAPGKAQGETDIVIEAKDYLPIHVGYTFDNYGSRFIGRNRNLISIEHNNLLGFDDQFYFQYMVAEDSKLANFKSGRYLFPLTKTTNLGFTGSYTRTKLGGEFIDAGAIGKSTVMGVFLNQSLISNQTLDLRLNLGFDYKRIRNYLLGQESSRDDSRVVKLGFDVDNRDAWGRTLFTVELDNGIPKILGGLDAKDPRSSLGTSGSGGKFFKQVFNLYRAQPLPFSAALLFKNSAQYTNNTLTAAEQFQIGGPYSVRGYAPAEYAGDRGLYSSVELTLPYYFLPKSWKVPFTQEKWFDATRFVVFYDWATVRMSHPHADDIKSRTIKGCGFGFRFNITNRISAKVELGYPLGGPKTTDSRHVQPWMELAVKF